MEHKQGAPQAIPDVQFLDQDSAAKLLGLSNPRTLAAWRLKRRGPPYCKLGRCVRYEREALLAWARRESVPA